MYEIIRFDEREKWEAEVNSVQSCDIYFHLNYCMLYQSLGDGDPYLFVYKTGENEKVLYPFLKRKVKSGPLSGKYFDITTPYGYGGPLYSKRDPSLVSGFRSAFRDYCQRENIVSEFIRFDPLMRNEVALHEWMDVQYVRDTVYIDLICDDPFSRYHPSHRRNVRKAMKAGLTFEILGALQASDEIDTFIHLYYKTMRKNRALPYYYFPKSYFKQLLHQLGENTVMAVIATDDTIIAAGLFMYEGVYLHYHLGCSDVNYLHLAPNNLLFHEVALWGKQQGFHYFHLGGGYRNNDSLFQFKRRFNPAGTIPFYVGRMVHNQSVYDELIRLWNQHNTKMMKTDFFPLYRQ